VPVQLTNIFHPAGSTLTLSKARRAKVDAFGITFDGDSGFSSSDFAWAG
jgi:predicted GNAT superfamily acetyltransferase